MFGTPRLCAILFVTTASVVVQAATYSIQPIASGSLGGSGFLTNVAGPGDVNELGVSVNLFHDDFTSHDVWAGTPASAGALYSAPGDFSGINNFPTINDPGDAVFRAQTATAIGFFRGNGGTTTPIALATGTNPFSNLGNRPHINDSGDVVFQGFTIVGGFSTHALYHYSGGTTTPITTPGGMFSSPQDTALITDSGDVYFDSFVGPTFSVRGLYRWDGTTATAVYDTTGVMAQFNGAFDVNESGRLAFTGLRDDGVRGIFSGDGGPLTVEVDESGPFRAIVNVAINDDEEIAFLAQRDGTPAGQVGIFTGPDPVADKVLAIGDTFFGGTVSFLDFYRGFNNRGQISFRAGINTGTTQIDGWFLATPMFDGDANGDGCVSGADFTIWGDHFGEGPGATVSEGDFNGDGFVTGADFTIWGDHFGDGCTPAAAVPEPGGWLLAIACACGLGMFAVARQAG